MAKYSVHISESTIGPSDTIPGRTEYHLSSKYFEYDKVEELANYIRTTLPGSDFLTSLARNINLKYEVVIKYTNDS